MILVASLLGGGLKNVILALTIGLLPTYIRLMCGQVLTVKETDYITAQQAMDWGMVNRVGESNFQTLISQVAGGLALGPAGAFAAGKQAAKYRVVCGRACL